MRAILTNSTLVELRDDTAVLACPPRFASGARTRLSDIEALLHKELGRRISVTIREDAPPADAAPDGAPAPEADAALDGRNGEAPAAAPGPVGPARSPLEDPLVKTAIELFEARIVSVQPRANG